jgi:hypothetical protein
VFVAWWLLDIKYRKAERDANELWRLRARAAPSPCYSSKRKQAGKFAGSIIQPPPTRHHPSSHLPAQTQPHTIAYNQHLKRKSSTSILTHPQPPSWPSPALRPSLPSPSYDLPPCLTRPYIELILLLGPCYRIPPCYSLSGAMEELPHTPCRPYVHLSARTELVMQPGRKLR